MRWLLLFLVGLIVGACGLSFNPDLPSGMEGTGDDGLTGSQGDGDSNDIGINNPPNAGSGGTGGAGGAGGATPEP